MRKLGAGLVASGLLVVIGALTWWFTSAPDDETSIAGIAQTAPEAVTAGPITLAIVGGFVILCGVVLLGARGTD